MKIITHNRFNSEHSLIRGLWFFGGLLLLHSSVGLAHDQAATGGEVNFEVSCDAESQAAVNKGMQLLHNMMYVPAEDTFHKATLSDKGCAMLHWGVAMSRFHPLWAGQPTMDDMTIGTAAIEQADAIGGVSQREQAYLDAAKAFYLVDGEVGYRKRLALWAGAQKSVYQSYPDDVDAVALYALAHLAVADKSDHTFSHQREAGELLEMVHENYPKHPAGFHYLIHAYDNPVLVDKARKVAETYDDIAPDVPHALHMPTHIFTRMGMWEQSIDWNRRAADSAIRQSTESMTLGHYAHAVDYLVYGYMQRGQIDKAETAVADLNALQNHQDSFGAAYALAAAPVRLALEQNNWKAAAMLPVNNQQAISWGRFPQMTATTQFAKGLGAARTGDTQAAHKAVKALSSLQEELISREQKYWATLVSSQTKTVQAWLALAENKADMAVALMLESAELEDSVDKHPVTPGWVLPARELLGDLYAQLDQPGDAISAYQATLARAPNRARSLRGAETAASKIGDSSSAAMYRQQLREINSDNEG